MSLLVAALHLNLIMDNIFLERGVWYLITILSMFEPLILAGQPFKKNPPAKNRSDGGLWQWSEKLFFLWCLECETVFSSRDGADSCVYINCNGAESSRVADEKRLWVWRLLELQQCSTSDLPPGGPVCVCCWHRPEQWNSVRPCGNRGIVFVHLLNAFPNRPWSSQQRHLKMIRDSPAVRNALTWT